MISQGEVPEVVSRVGIETEIVSPSVVRHVVVVVVVARRHHVGVRQARDPEHSR